MWALSVAIFAGCKWLTWWPVRRDASLASSLSYLFAWPGLDAQAFLGIDRRPVINARPLSEWLFAAFKTLFGFVLIFAVAGSVAERYPLAAGWVGMAGIVFVLHFGLFHLLACFWRSRAVDARPLMNWPIASTSVSQFWGQRWNTAFRDLAHRFLFRPLTIRFGPRAAIAGGFLFSGIVHDAVISLPAGGGYGLPTLYFALQGMALLLERSRLGKAIGLGGGWRGRLFALVVIVGPASLLFHTPFNERIVRPFLEAMGALQ